VLRAAKNQNGVIVCIGNDESQSGTFVQGDVELTWCDWTFEEIPTFVAVEGAEDRVLRFKENLAGDGIELRTDEEVIQDPQG
jgi:hypothetical protein